MQSTRVEISSRTERALLFVGASLVAACSLVVDTDGLSGGASGPGASDGGRDVLATDGSVSESGTDAGTDARYCDRFKPAGSVTFCDDFDDPTRTDPTTGWDRDNVDRGGALAIVPAGRSMPNALQATWAANQASQGDCSYVRLIRDMPKAVSKFTYGFDVFLGDDSGGSFFDDALTDFVWLASASPKYCQLYLRNVTSSPSLNDDNSERPLKKAFTRGVWHRVEISLDGPKGAVTMIVDGEDAFTKPERVPDGCGGTMTVSLLHGLFCAEKNPGAERVLYDNITFDGE